MVSRRFTEPRAWTSELYMTGISVHNTMHTAFIHDPLMKPLSGHPKITWNSSPCTCLCSPISSLCLHSSSFITVLWHFVETEQSKEVRLVLQMMEVSPFAIWIQFNHIYLCLCVRLWIWALGWNRALTIAIMCCLTVCIAITSHSLCLTHRDTDIHRHSVSQTHTHTHTHRHAQSNMLTHRDTCTHIH